MSSIRILVVDDHEIARRGIRSVLRGNANIEIVGEAADGEQGIRLAGELHPDIVLLDVSLPGMSGMEAAPAIRTASPNSRIIFVSQHISRTLAEKALKEGASGYVVKSDAGLDLLPAVQAVREGHTFISRTLQAHS